MSEALKYASELGVELFSVRGKGYRLAEPIEFLDAGEATRAMGAAAARIGLELVDETDSTSTRLVERAAAGAPSGTAGVCSNGFLENCSSSALAVFKSTVLNPSVNQP